MRRREFFRVTAAGLVAAATPAVQPRTAYGQRSKELVWCSTGGSYMEAVRKAWLEPFEKETGIKVIDVFPFDLGKLETMVKTKNVEWDLADIPGTNLGTIIAKDLVEPLDYRIINAEGLPRGASSEFACAICSYSTVLAFSTKRFAPGSPRPDSWADFWDVKKFPGPRSLRKVPWVQLEVALLADGVPADKLYPLDVDRAFRKLDEIKPHVKVWWTSGAQPIQLLADNEVDMTITWNARMQTAKSQGAKVDITWNQGALAFCTEVVARGARNRENAMRLLNYVISPKAQAKLTEFTPSAPVNSKAYEFIKPEVAKDLSSAPPNAARQWVLGEQGWWAKNLDAMRQRFDEWVIR